MVEMLHTKGNTINTPDVYFRSLMHNSKCIRLFRSIHEEPEENKHNHIVDNKYNRIQFEGPEDEREFSQKLMDNIRLRNNYQS